MNASATLNLANTALPTTAEQAKAFMSTSFPVVKDANTKLDYSNLNSVKKEDVSVGKQEEVASDVQEDAASGIVPTLQNIVATVNLDCRLDLKTIALHARNAEYNPKVCTFSLLF